MDHNEVKKRLLQNPEFKKEWDRFDLLFELQQFKIELKLRVISLALKIRRYFYIGLAILILILLWVPIQFIGRTFTEMARELMDLIDRIGDRVKRDRI
jgi:hypothetical protein